MARDCAICSSNAIINFYCLQCKTFYCGECRNKHDKSSYFTHHGICLDTSKFEGDIPVCSMHGDAVDAFCDMCNKELCAKCVISNHYDHDLSRIDDVIVIWIEGMSHASKNLAGKVDNLVTSQQIQNKSLEEYKSGYETIRKKIKFEARKMKDALESEEKQLLEKVESIFESKVELVYMQTEKLNSTLEETEHHLRQAKHLSNPIGILEELNTYSDGIKSKFRKLELAANTEAVAETEPWRVGFAPNKQPARLGYIWEGSDNTKPRHVVTYTRKMLLDLNTSNLSSEVREQMKFQADDLFLDDMDDIVRQEKQFRPSREEPEQTEFTVKGRANHYIVPYKYITETQERNAAMGRSRQLDESNWRNR